MSHAHYNISAGGRGQVPKRFCMPVWMTKTEYLFTEAKQFAHIWSRNIRVQLCCKRIFSWSEKSLPMS